MQITILTIRSISYLCLFISLSLMSRFSSAAIVSVSALDNSNNKTIYSKTTKNAYSNSDVFVNETSSGEFSDLFSDPDTSLGTIEENSGEELIFIGASESCNLAGNGNHIIDINLFNSNNQTTGGVSFVLSSAEDMIWNFNLGNPEASQIDINNIYILGQKSQTININGSSLSLLTNSQTTVDDIIISRGVSICGYTLPEDDQGCETDELLGLPNRTVNGEQTNRWDENVLGNLTSLKVTSFNGTMFLDEVNVTIDTSPIPVPASFLLFLTSILGLITLKKKSKFNL